MELRGRIIVLAVLMFLFSMLQPGSARDVAQSESGSSFPKQFVRANGLGFALEDGSSFRPVGSNVFWAVSWMHHNDETRSTVRKALDEIAELGGNVIRLWAFAEGNTSLPFQPRPRQYNEARELYIVSRRNLLRPSS